MIKTPLSTVIGGAFWTPSCTILGGTSKTFNQIIKSLFANNEQGFVYDPNDLTTMFQDAAGTVPVTAVGQAVGLVLDKSKGLVGGAQKVPTGSWVAVSGAVVTNQSDYGFRVQSIAGDNFAATYKTITGLVVGRMYKLTCTCVKNTNATVSFRLSPDVGSSLSATYDVFLALGTNTIDRYFFATTTTLQVGVAIGAELGDVTVSNISVKELAGNHAYQTQAAMRPLLVASPQRLDYDTVDDKLITNLPAQLTSCTVIRAVPNVGTQILTGQTIPATYDDNTDHCGLIVVNRALTATETSQITKLFNKAAGV